jgi:hypothetical protein
VRCSGRRTSRTSSPPVNREVAMLTVLHDFLYMPYLLRNVLIDTRLSTD